MKVLGAVLAALLLGLGAASIYIASPTEDRRALPEPLSAFDERDAQRGGPYWADFRSLRQGFKPQTYRSFCGPATVATVLRAYGLAVDQRELFPSVYAKVDTFYTGLSLDDLSELASNAGLKTQIVYADRLTLDLFRTLLASNLSRDGDYIVVNYDRRVLKQTGRGHISAVGAYDPALDRVLVLDEASYRFPFTWVPLPLLFEAVHTRAGKLFRGVLVITGRKVPRAK